MSGYYPPGVTGHEYAIAGPTVDVDRALDGAPCTGCGVDPGVIVGTLIGDHDTVDFIWTCPTCGVENEALGLDTAEALA